MAEPTLDELIAWAEDEIDAIDHFSKQFPAEPGTGVEAARAAYRARRVALAAHLRELRDLRAKVAAVREMHAPASDCECNWPCPTIAALDAGGGA